MLKLVLDGIKSLIYYILTEVRVTAFRDIAFATFNSLNFSIARVLIVTGDPHKNGQKTEIIDLINLKYSILDDTSKRWGAVGGLVKGQPLICGGHDGNSYLKDCVIFGQLHRDSTMLEKRRGAACVSLNKTVLWVTGGRGDTYG